MLLCVSLTFTTLMDITLNLLADFYHHQLREKD